MTISVKNTGDRDGKEVVQLYYTAPYTDFDKTNKIEKPVKNLVAFDKVEVAKGVTEEVTLTFAKEDMASYCYTRDNGDGTKGCYVLENGEYTITLGKNSHDAWDSRTTTINETVWYDNDNPRQTEKDGQSLLDRKRKSDRCSVKERRGVHRRDKFVPGQQRLYEYGKGNFAYQVGLGEHAAVGS